MNDFKHDETEQGLQGTTSDKHGDVQVAEPAWWSRSISRRDAAKVGLSVAALASIAGCDSSKVVDMDSIAAQKKGGWDVGDSGKSMSLAGAVGKDSTGSADWRAYAKAQKLLGATKPKSDVYVRWQMPSLIQALEQPTLAAAIRPVSTSASKDSENRARALGTLLGAMENAKETLLVVDLPGAHGPAAAAGLSPWAEPIFFYDGWPHPKGVVKSQETLGSLVYYGRELEANAQKRDAAKAAPAIFLDANRTTVYTKPDTQFDNRYLAALPEVEDLKKAGIKRVMLVSLTETASEADDLNDQFVAYDGAGIQTITLALSDFKKDPDYVAKAGEEADPNRGYYYGGQHRSHTHFFMFYPFFMWGGPRYGYRSPRTSSAGRARKSSYKARARQTMFSGRKTGGVKGVGRSKPVGFGRVSTRQGSGGKIMGTRSGSTGSFGRGRSGSSYGG